MARKNTTEIFLKALPTLLGNLISYMDETVTAKGKKQLLSSANGTLGLLINIFGKPFLDKYFKRVSNNKLKDFGFATYAKAAFVQVTESLQTINDEASMPHPDIPALLVEKNFFQSIGSYNQSFSLMVFQPKYHPAVQLVKAVITDMLLSLKINVSEINKFKKHFSDNIESAVQQEFGEDYDEHKEKLRKYWFEENETRLLLDIIEQAKIGFVDEENLSYEHAFGSWKSITERTYGEDDDISKIEKSEQSLEKVEDLVSQYFNSSLNNHIEQVLFIIADFGKGKSVFLKQYAAQLAQDYFENGDGYFPVYFNLRNYASFSSETKYGIIEDFLQTKYAIKIDSEYFKSKKYIFLVDSLDESGDLSASSIDKVVASIKRIQNLDKTIIRTNRIVITSRPFHEHLFNVLTNNAPFTKKISSKEIPHYISLYGFKKDQFNEWISVSLKSIIDEVDIRSADPFIQKVLNNLKRNKISDVYSELLNSQTLKSSELRRPIFAYMIYMLIRNNVNITKVGKIGIYLSFLNLLSKEAKYIHDPNLKISIQEQFEARNTLHHIASLWTYERLQGRQGLLKKADICRLITAQGNELSDEEVVEEFKKTGGSDIQFLSHSYFGENDNMLHFQHQSFAEILLAEYYVKVLIKCALDRSQDIEFAISKLKIGLPTPQTIEFFKEILALLKETSENSSYDSLEKKKLLTPLLASISIINNNKTLYSDLLYYQWYTKGQINKHTTEIPDILVKEWCINEQIIDSIINLCEKIILSDKVYLLSKSESKTALIEGEISYIMNSNYDLTIVLEKQLALIAGNVLYNNDDKYFLSRFPSHINSLLLSSSKDDWSPDHFPGLSIIGENHRRIISRKFFNFFNLKNSIFENVSINRSSFYGCNFRNANMKNVAFRETTFIDCDFTEVKLEGFVDFTTAIFDRNLRLPSNIGQIIRANANRKAKDNNSTVRGLSFDRLSIIKVPLGNVKVMRRYFKEWGFYFSYCLKNGFLTRENLFFEFETEDMNLNELLEDQLNTIVESST